MEYTGAPDEPLLEKIPSRIDRRESPTSSDSDAEKSTSSSSVKAKIYRMLGRERPVHKVLGGGKPADLLLWRDKKFSASILAAATIIWVMFELVEYHFITFASHTLIVALAGAFVWVHAVSKSPDNIPEIYIPEEPFLLVASELRTELNSALAALRDIASGRDLRKFLLATVALWVLSVVGNLFDFFTLIYICLVLLLTLPVLYEKYEDEIDPVVERAMTELKKHYDVLDAKLLSKLPRGSLKAKKF